MRFDKFKFKWFFFNIKHRFKYYSLLKGNDKNTLKDTMVFFVGEKKVYPGIADIIKSIVGSYYIAKSYSLDFKIVFDMPFDLSKFLIPNAHDWKISDEQINKSWFNTQLINYRGIGGLPRIKEKKQFHIRNYQGINILQRNNLPNWKVQWHYLFTELFKPSDALQSKIDSLGIVKEPFISIHIRFINTLEVLEPSCLSWSRPLDIRNREILLSKLFAIIDSIKRSENKKVYIFSDSELFLSEANKMGYNTLPGKVGHVGYDSKDEIVMKTFVDWFAMSLSDKIYRIKGKPLYESAFPLYSSLIGNKEYVEIQMD